MKSNPLTAILLGVLIVTTLASVVLCGAYVRYSHELRSMHFLVNRITYNRALAQAVAKDALKYSEKNPAIDPILESVGAKPARSAATTNKPAAK